MRTAALYGLGNIDIGILRDTALFCFMNTYILALKYIFNCIRSDAGVCLKKIINQHWLHANKDTWHLLERNFLKVHNLKTIKPTWTSVEEV